MSAVGFVHYRSQTENTLFFPVFVERFLKITSRYRASAFSPNIFYRVIGFQMLD